LHLAPGLQPDLSRCLNELPWPGWPYEEPPEPGAAVWEDVVSTALRLAVAPARGVNINISWRHYENIGPTFPVLVRHNPPPGTGKSLGDALVGQPCLCCWHIMS
jgi:hypothetical protein